MLHAVVEALPLEDVEVGHRDGGRHRVPAEGVPVGEAGRARPERLEQPVAGDQGADGGVAAGHRLGAGDHVRHVAEVVAGEHRPDPPERADDLVGDQQDVVGVADLAHPVEVAGRGREAAAGVLHRLQEHRRDRLGPLEQDGLLDAVGRPAAERLGVVAQVLRGAVGVGVGHLERARDQRLEHLLGRRDARDGQRPLRGAVVGDRTADDLVLGGPPDQLPVLLGQLPRRLHGLPATGGEEDPVQVARGVVRQPLGQLDGRRVRVGPQREERELRGLLRRRLGELAPAVAGVDREQSREPVQEGPAAVVGDAGALAGDDDGHLPALLVGRVPREVLPQVVPGCVLARGATRCQVHVGPGRGGLLPGLLWCDGHRVPQS